MSYTIALLTGGASTERQIALASAESVRRALESRAKVEVFDFPKDMEQFIARRNDFDCAIPVFHGRGGEDGTIQGWLEILGVPYIFSSVGAHAIAIDKSKANCLVATTDVRVPKSVVVSAADQLHWTHEVVIKPIDGGSSVGVTLAHSPTELERGVRAALRVSTSAMIEDYVHGREFSVAVIDLDGATQALPVISIESKHEFFDYDSKYTPGLATEICPANIDSDLAARLQAAAVTVHRVIGCRHVSRSDFILSDDGTIWFLEVNTIPGMSVLLPKAIAASGREFGEVLLRWVEDVVHAHE